MLRHQFDLNLRDEEQRKEVRVEFSTWSAENTQQEFPLFVAKIEKDLWACGQQKPSLIANKFMTNFLIS
jgi:hypothetical protein